MALERHQVTESAHAFIDTLSKLSPKEREGRVAPSYAEAMNKLIELAKEVAPEVDARLWPQPIRIQSVGAGGVQVFATYVDVETAARLIVKLIPREIFRGTV